MILCFELSMPNRASWNGRWSGEESKHYILKSSQAKLTKDWFQELDGKSWTYHWDDGWTALITAEVIDAKEAARRRRRNSGFCGYDWMVRDILDFGGIKQR